MLHHLDKYKNYKAPIQKETKYNRGFSFYKTDANESSGRVGRESGVSAKGRDPSYSASNKSVSDCYFFPAAKQAEVKEEKTKTVLPSCMFKN